MIFCVFSLPVQTSDIKKEDMQVYNIRNGCYIKIQAYTKTAFPRYNNLQDSGISIPIYYLN